MRGREGVAFERALAPEPSWPESRQNNPRQQVSHTSSFLKKKTIQQIKEDFARYVYLKIKQRQKNGWINYRDEIGQ